MAIDTSLTSLSSLNPYSITTDSSSGTSSSTTSSSTTIDNSSNPVSATNNPAALQQALELASEASVIVTLGGSSSSSDSLTYNAAGLYNSFVNAGSSANVTPDTTQNQATQSLQQGELDSIASTSSTSGVYNGSGVFTGQDGLTAQESALLQTNPDLASTFVSDAATQGIVGSLISTTA
ncbi:hypothetical protein [Herbaspirillum sp. NPDC087042]|uniref:hypothetical protein n=1 Tax=Herbaspirillum sp. NPDC087042 TaxID=3364004 RepID=UPI0037F54A40